MGWVSDCQANGNHQPPPPPPPAGAEQVVEEGDAGGTINGNYQPPELVAEAGQVVEEGDAGVTMEGVSRHFHRLAAYWCHLRPFHSAPGLHLLRATRHPYSSLPIPPTAVADLFQVSRLRKILLCCSHF